MVDLPLSQSLLTLFTSICRFAQSLHNTQVVCLLKVYATLAQEFPINVCIRFAHQKIALQRQARQGQPYGGRVPRRPERRHRRHIRQDGTALVSARVGAWHRSELAQAL